MKLLQILMMAAKKGLIILINTCAGWTSNYRWENVECDGDDLVLSKLEDYRNYTEADANDRFTVEKNKITVSGLQRNDTGHYIYKDMGTDFFDGDFEHIIHAKATAHTNGGVLAIWGMANTVNTWNNICSASGNTLELSFFRQDSSTFKFNLIEMVNGSRVENSTTYSLDTDYYIEVERDESIGTYGRIYARIYSDEARTTLVQTLQLNLRAKIDFRYVYAVNNWADGKSGSFSGEIEQRNIDLYQESGKRVSTPVLIPAHKNSNIQWEDETDADTDVKIYTGISDSDDEEPEPYTEVTNDSTIPDLEANKYLYCKQVLSTEDTSKTPKLNSLKIKIT